MSATAQPAAPRPARWSAAARPETLAIAALTALALALRVTSLSRSLFTDEAYSLALAQRSFGGMIELFGNEANGMPYPIVLWPLIRVFGDGEAVLRLPSVIAGTAAVPALWWAARRLASPAAALVAAGLLAVSPMAVFYSQVARPYAFVVLAGCLAFGALALALERERGGAWVGYSAALALLAYCDLFAAPIVLPAMALLARRSGPGGVRRWLQALAVSAVMCVPLLVAAVIARSRRDAIYWLKKPDRTLVSVTLEEFTGGQSGLTSVRWATVLVAVVLVGLALALAARRSADRERTAFGVAVGWGVLAPLILFLAAFIHPVFWPRYAIVAVPGLCLLGGLACVHVWSSGRWRAAAPAALALLVALAVVADARQRTKLQEDWPPVAALLKAQRAPGEPTILDNINTLPALGYYDSAFRDSQPNLVVQEWREAPLPAGVVGFKDPHGYGSAPDGPVSAAQIAALARSGAGSVWVIYAEVDKDLQSGDPRQGPAAAWARSHCRTSERETVGVWVLHATGCS